MQPSNSDTSFTSVSAQPFLGVSEPNPKQRLVLARLLKKNDVRSSSEKAEQKQIRIAELLSVTAPQHILRASILFFFFSETQCNRFNKGLIVQDRKLRSGTKTSIRQAIMSSWVEPGLKSTGQRFVRGQLTSSVKSCSSGRCKKTTKISVTTRTLFIGTTIKWWISSLALLLLLSKGTTTSHCFFFKLCLCKKKKKAHEFFN